MPRSKNISLDDDLTFRNRPEALRTLYRMVRDEREWFGGVTEETSEMGRLIFRNYFVKTVNKPVGQRRQISFGYNRRKAA